MTQQQQLRGMVALASVLLAVATLLGQLAPIRASLFEVGAGCVYAMESVRGSLGEPELERLDIAHAIRTISLFCNSLMRNSLGGILIFRVLPELTSLVASATNGSLAAEAELYNFALSMRRVAATIELSSSPTETYVAL